MALSGNFISLWRIWIKVGIDVELEILFPMHLIIPEVIWFSFELSGQKAPVVMANSTRLIIGATAEPGATAESCPADARAQTVGTITLVLVWSIALYGNLLGPSGSEVPAATLVAKILLIRAPYEKFEIGSNYFFTTLPKKFGINFYVHDRNFIQIYRPDLEN